MALIFEGIEYRTIADVIGKYNVSERSIREWQKKGLIVAPETVVHGGKKFKHYTDSWCSQFEEFLRIKHQG